jgi:hypothetical protein
MRSWQHSGGLSKPKAPSGATTCFTTSPPSQSDKTTLPPVDQPPRFEGLKSFSSAREQNEGYLFYGPARSHYFDHHDGDR